MSIETLIHEWRQSIKENAEAKADAEYLREFRRVRG